MPSPPTETIIVDESSTTTKVSPPLFDFPKEEPRTFTAKDLIAIMSLYNARFKTDKAGNPILPTPKEAASSEALDILNGKGSRQRMIFREWPRDPKGEPITVEGSAPGKVTPNGLQLWGATMFDFYRVRRMPDVASLSTITTGSKLLRWMKAHNELEYAKDEIEWAEMEEKPTIIDLWSPCKSIERTEKYIRRGKAGRPMEKKDVKEKKVSTGSIFNRKRLTSRIDLDHLPKKLIVHDPWNVLAADSVNAFGRAERFKTEEWTSKQDRIHVYRLQLSKYSIARTKREAEARANKQKYEESINNLLDGRPEQLDLDNKDGALEGYMIRPPAVDGPVEPPVFVVHGPPPQPFARASVIPKPIEEAHLYLSPAHTVGTGNHSVVYNAEWELPRAAVMPTPSSDYILCEKCVAADIARIIREEDGEHGERKESKWEELSGRVTIVEEGRPPVVLHLVQSHNVGKPNKEEGQFETEGKTTLRAEYIGPVRPIRTTVEWQDPMHPTCEHIKPPLEVPPTVKMRVVGKISLARDVHLAQEATNYELFEQHMFEHWSGLNVVPPMHDPVPVGALVPQYYGYYVPDEDSDDEKGTEGKEEANEDTRVEEEDRSSNDTDSSSTATERERKDVGYLSPILLLEDCGTQVDPSKLNYDQSNEALSYIYRFHFAGWAHGSVYPRNILAQPGPLDVPPSQRRNATPSFRLIDFGRSYHVDKMGKKQPGWVGDRYHEEAAMEKLFGMYMF
ncbi:hypothetical protein H0H87_001044 [Tephrocybe sp. NHM501043]|nr:hypothetical protein H0H87_001044 [Tephrocybe sp. NHM501043]